MMADSKTNEYIYLSIYHFLSFRVPVLNAKSIYIHQAVSPHNSGLNMMLPGFFIGVAWCGKCMRYKNHPQQSFDFLHLNQSYHSFPFPQALMAAL